jgi:tetratricopeptide (TPR) repeat protein
MNQAMRANLPCCRLTRGLVLLLSIVGVSAVAASTDQAPATQEDLATLMAAAGRALEAGDLEAAAGRFSEVTLLAPQVALAWLGLSEVAERRGEPLEALRYARQAARLAPDDPQAILAVSRQLSRLMRFEESLEALARLRELDPARPEGYLLASAVLRRTGGEEEAVRVLESGLAADIGDPRLHEELALVLLSAGSIERAQQVATAGVERFPDHGGLRGALGLALAADPQRRTEALASLDSALDLGVSSPAKIHLEMATLLREQGANDRALDHLRRAATLRPDSPEVHYLLGSALRDAGDIEGAREALGRYQDLKRVEQQAAQADRTVGTRFNEAQSLANQNRLPEALSAVEALLADHPTEDRALALRGKVLFSIGRREEALASIVAARESVASQVEYHYLEGLFLLQLGRASEAEAPLRRAVALVPDLAEGHTLLGMALSSAERYEAAVGAFERALELGAEGTTLRLGFAEALRGAGRLAESEEQMEAYRRLAEG